MIDILQYYLFFSFVFFIFMTYQGFWKTQNITLRIILSFFWPVSIAIIYIAIRKKLAERL